MSNELTMPSHAMAESMTRELGWDERLTGHKISPIVGTLPEELFTFADAADFLHLGSGEQMKIHGNHAHIGYIEPTALKTWVLAQFGDTELVAAIDAAMAQGLNPWMVMEPIRDAMQQRLEQVRSVVKA
jgi:hypothetical protein